MAEGMQLVEDRLRPTKEALFAELLAAPNVHSVLEVGIGTGPNLPFYAQRQQQQQQEGQQALRIVGVDPNEAMFPYTQRSAESAGLEAGSLSLVDGTAEAMPLPTGSMDAAVITLVLCSVTDVAGALAEVRRVVRPGGSVLLVEHVIAPQPGLMRLAQEVLDPVQQVLADGCHLTRDTRAAVAQAGFRNIDQLRQLEVDGLGILSPFIAGIVQV